MLINALSLLLQSPVACDACGERPFNYTRVQGTRVADLSACTCGWVYLVALREADCIIAHGIVVRPSRKYSTPYWWGAQPVGTPE